VGVAALKHSLWHTVRAKAHILFPALTVLVAAVILTSPLYKGPLGILCRNDFARFCMFWCLAVTMVLSWVNRHVRPATVATAASAAALVVGVAFYGTYSLVLGAPSDAPDMFLSCLSGAILGALAGTWLIYALEVYADHHR
jgi:hypothetical protein